MLALALRGVAVFLIAGTGCLDINADPVSDMEAFHRWALTIRAGDWLGRSDFHPYHPWQTGVAEPATWERWYGHVFHQEPFYPYLIATIYLLAPPGPISVVIFQILAGSIGCGLVYLAARRIVPEEAALIAGVFSCFYGPYIFYEMLLLRDTILVPLGAALLWVLVEARHRGSARGAGPWWGACGALFGIMLLTKASILLFLALVLAWLVALGRELIPWRHIAVLVSVFLLTLSPICVRNLIVGAPVLTFTTRGPIEFINGNSPYHIGLGWFDGDDRRVSQYARETLEEADGRLIPTIASVLEDWSSRPVAFARLQLVKTGYLFAPFEMPNNASFSYFRENSMLMRHATLSFFWIGPLALLGLARSWRIRREMAPVLLFLLSGVAVTVPFYVIARFRIPLMPAVMILAGLGTWGLASDALRGRIGRVLLSGSLLLAGLAVNAYSTYPDRMLVRPQDYLIAIDALVSRGELEAALDQASRARELFPRYPHFHRAAGMIYLELGRRPEALEALRTSLTVDPADEETRDLVERLSGGSPLP